MAPTLYLLCGLPGAGKTTRAKELEAAGKGVLLNADRWVWRLHPDDAEAAARDERKAAVEELQWSLAERLLLSGISVIADWGLWSRAERDFYRQRASDLGADARIVFVDAQLEELHERIAQRNRNPPVGTFHVSAQELDEWASIFEAPTQNESALPEPGRSDALPSGLPFRDMSTAPDMLDPANIEAAAIDQAGGLTDFDGDEWREGLDRFVASLRADAQLNEMGPIVAATQVTNALASRLKIIDQHNQHPEIAETPVAPPIVIAGQPRTGTTILFDLLAQDPQLRAPLTWEVDAPVPPPETATYETDPRIAKAAEGAALSEAVMPGFQAIHPSGPSRAQECVAIMVGDCKSLQLGTVFRVPTYTRWLLNDADMSSTYRYHRQFLQVLQWKHRGERWILKTPAHQWHFAELFATYPDATVIHNHRDPLKVVASVSSLMTSLQRLGRDEAPIQEIAAEWFDYLTDGNDRSVAARLDGTVPAKQFIDVAFRGLMQDTFGTIESIYGQLGLDYTDEARVAMESFLADNAADKHGRHTYTFADTGLDLTASRERVSDYESHFSVEREVSP